MNQFFKSLPILYLFTLVGAQYGNPGNSGSSTMTSSSLPSSTTTSATEVQTVTVGASGLTFSPDTLTVSPGGKVEFHFQPGHSVTQASFANPCHPLSDTSISSGIVSGSNGGSSSIFTVTINDTNPIWYYCGQPGHCQAGMVGVINPPSTGSDTLAAFKASAATANGTTIPASVNGGVFGGASASSSPSASGTSASSPSSPSHTGDARVLGAWTDMTVLLVLSVLAAMFMV
ncbi:hypothetical protein DPV78_011071 [Talaromyces pinophilus]|nr:hypothetical protein DPV78_011071 [Talaromyces pinophilus]